MQSNDVEKKWPVNITMQVWPAQVESRASPVQNEVWTPLKGG